MNSKYLNLLVRNMVVIWAIMLTLPAIPQAQSLVEIAQQGDVEQASFDKI